MSEKFELTDEGAPTEDPVTGSQAYYGWQTETDSGGEDFDRMD